MGSLDVPLKQQANVLLLTIIPATATLIALMNTWSLVYIAYSKGRLFGLTNSGLCADFLLFVKTRFFTYAWIQSSAVASLSFFSASLYLL